MKKLIVYFFTFLFLASTLTGCKNNDYGLDPKKPTNIIVWNYYNGNNKKLFDDKVDAFNMTDGKEKGIVVKSLSFNNVADLYTELDASINKSIGAKEVPDVVQIYNDYAWKLSTKDMAVDLNKYFNETELNAYVKDFINEGIIDNKLLVLPIAKSSEVLILNSVDWNKYAKENNVDIKTLDTYEGLASVASDYHAKTGEALFGRDAFANYMLVGGQQLGTNYVKVVDGKTELDIDAKAVRRLWDNYYVPFIKGDYASKGKYRSDDIKTRDIIGMVGSSTAISFFPKNVMRDGEATYIIEPIVAKAPVFANTSGVSISQGAGMSIIKSDEKSEYAASVFLKWFTSIDVNTDFSLKTGYTPVLVSSNESSNINKGLEKIKASESLRSSANIASTTLMVDKHYKETLYPEAANIRKVLEKSMPEKADKDYQTITKEIANGANKDEVYMKYINDDNFNEWYKAFCEEMKLALEASYE
ncbi:MAG: extracellular solute-binding protein [Erysipelotrichaceae bacterium]